MHFCFEKWIFALKNACSHLGRDKAGARGRARRGTGPAHREAPGGQLPRGPGRGRGKVQRDLGADRAGGRVSWELRMIQL